MDVFVAEPFDFPTEYDAAMIVQAAPGVSVRVLQLRTLLKLKREAGRPQDLADVAELENIQGNPDRG